MKNKEIVFRDIVFTFGISKACNVRYSKVLTMHVLDPETGKRMSIPRRQQVPCTTELKEREITKSHYFTQNDLNEKDVKQAAQQCAAEIYAKYETLLIRKLRIKPEVGKINSNQMYTRYVNDFMCTQRRASSATQKEKRRTLRNACTELMDKPIVKLTDRDIDKLFKNEKCSKKKNLIRDFFEYCRNRNAYTGIN